LWTSQANRLSKLRLQAVNGGNLDTFDMYVTDLTQSKTCSTTGITINSIGTPTQTLLMFEIGNYAGTVYTLPSFGFGGGTNVGVNYYGITYYGVSLYGIIDPCNSGYYNTWSMWNPNNSGYHNIGFSTVFTNIIWLVPDSNSCVRMNGFGRVDSQLRLVWRTSVSVIDWAI
jgi:hypothetical protein